MSVIIRRGSNDPFFPVELMSSPFFPFAPLDAQLVAMSTSFPIRTILTFQHLNRDN